MTTHWRRSFSVHHLGRIVSILLATVAAMPAWVMAQTVPSHPKQQQPSRSQHEQEVWVTTEGSVPFGDDTTLGHARTASREQARRAAVEKAVGTFIESMTVVYNSQLAEDIVRSAVRGIVTDEQIVEEGVRSNKPEDGTTLRYVTRLRARIRALPYTHAKGMAITAALNKSVYLNGEEMELRVKAEEDLYLHVFNVGQDEVVTMLFPNDHARDNKLTANTDFVFPSKEQRELGLRVRAFTTAHSGKVLERLKIIATRRNVDFGKGRFAQGIYKVYPGKDSALIIDLLREISLIEPSDWTEATLVFEIREQ